MFISIMFISIMFISITTILTSFILILADRSLIQLQPDIITARITQLLQTESAQRVPTSLPISSSTNMVQDSCSPTRTDCTVKQYRPRQIQPTWLRWKSWSSLIGRAWDMEICRSHQGWDLSLRVYAYVSPDSLVAKYTCGGDVEGLRRLFSQGLASPFTVCPAICGGVFERRTLLDVRVMLSMLLLLSLTQLDWSPRRESRAL